MAKSSGDVRRNPELVWDVAAIAGLFLGSLVFLMLCMNRTVSVYDEALLLEGAVRVLEGAVPHRDFYALYGPGQFYVLAGLYKIFGVSVLVERFWDTLVCGCIVVLVFVVVSQVARRPIALVAAVASLVWLTSFGGYGSPMFPALAASMAWLALLAPALARGGPATRLIMAGVCAGVALLFRYDVGVAIFGTGCALLGFSAWCRNEAAAQCFRTLYRTVMLFGAGFAIVVVPLAAAFAFYGVIPDLIFQVVVFPARSYAKTRSLPFPRRWVLRADPAEFIGVYLPLATCAAAVPTLVAIVRRRPISRGVEESAASGSDRWAIPPWTLLTLVVLTLVLYAKGLVRVSVIHMSMALIVALALAATLTQPVTGRRLFGRGAVLAAVMACTLLTLFFAHADLHNALRNIAWSRNPASWEQSATGMPPASGSCCMPDGLQQMACSPMSVDTFNTIRYVQQHTAADDPIFVGLSRHDKVFINDMLLYFATNRRPATKWYHFDPGLQTSAPIQQAMVGELQRARPRLIVLEFELA